MQPPGMIDRRALLRLLGATTLAGTTAAETAASSGADAQFERHFGDAFLEQYWQRNRDSAIAVGYYAVADRLSVPDERYRADYLAFLDRTLAQLHRIAPAALDPGHRTDWAVLRGQLLYERWALTELRDWQWNPAQYNVAQAFALILHADYAPLDQRLRAALSRLADVPAYYQAARAAVAHPTLEHTTLAIGQNRGALDLFGDDLAQLVVTSGLEATERGLFEQRRSEARAAIEDYVSWLEKLAAQLRSGGARSFRLGRTLYQQKFRYLHQSGESAEALYQRARHERAQVLDRMEELTRQLWPRYFPATLPPTDRFESIGRMIDKLAENHVAPSDYLARIERLIGELADWVSERGLIAIELKPPLEVRPTPQYERGVSIASVEAPGPYDAGERTYFNVDPIDQLPATQAESYLREYNNWMLPVFIMHEAIPGHYVQLMYANRSPSRIKSLFGNGAMVEGWAVYSERMMLESGYGAQAPEQWLVYWKWYLRSVTNTVLDYAVHVLDMSEARVKQILSREAFQSAQEADSKWVRLQRSSVQLTSYYAGFSAIYGLRERVRAQQGAQFELKRFHEQFLSYGSAPVHVIADLMLPAARG